MELSIFDVLGPVMIGPSSSHTAGAARLAKVAAEIAFEPFDRVDFGLSGSFAKTCRGHGTDKALIAGAVGLAADDEGIRDADKLAARQGITWQFYPEDLDWMHENSVHFTFHHLSGRKSEIWGSSLGGGRVLVSRINHFDTHLYADSPAILVNHLDRPGVISDVSRVLAQHDLNIAVLRLARAGRGGLANAMFIVDTAPPPQVPAEIRALDNVTEVIVVDVS